MRAERLAFLAFRDCSDEIRFRGDLSSLCHSIKAVVISAATASHGYYTVAVWSVSLLYAVLPILQMLSFTSVSRMVTSWLILTPLPQVIASLNR